MSSGERCEECGTAIPSDSPGGFCAQCLLGLGLREMPSADCGVQNEEVEGQRSEEPYYRAADGKTRRPNWPLSAPAGTRSRRMWRCLYGGAGGAGAPPGRPEGDQIGHGHATSRGAVRSRAAGVGLDGPSNIAKVLDAGATDAGRPYFVMELVGGTKITDYCDHHQLTTRERLALFIQVCRAIQHAHQKGVIHRDIKPSNVLVATHDGVAVPQVIDFCIAKATQGRLTDQTLFTAFEQFIGTPAYMSPEQSVLTSVDIDTRSDIYSLGVLLYELLTSQTPFDQKELLKSGFD